MLIKRLLRVFILLILVFSCSSISEEELVKSQIKEYPYKADFMFNSLKRSLLKDDFNIEVVNKKEGYIVAYKFYKKFWVFGLDETFETIFLKLNEKENKTKLYTKFEYGIIGKGKSSEYGTDKYKKFYKNYDEFLANEKTNDVIEHTYTFSLKDKEKLMKSLKYLFEDSEDTALKIYDDEGGFVSYEKEERYKCFISNCFYITNYYFTLYEKDNKLKLNIRIDSTKKDGSKHIFSYVKHTDEKEYEKIINKIRKGVFTL